ncbi:MAG: hypothetical protein A2Z99_18880 [Treponema sp. GWB1_62_6]|nr:MAG: hypothetical protein A2Z99_18880 [Treponema sp. GWB1_62_6]OHE64160.1 MAG: hypothetical protein A2001_11205 [Treponema sp. GWC1_61_84]OHE75047.1 MAG: hypothetical protein A2413_08225 [Treponema sp. RIFOXYC1_FULL_61_9]
MSERILIPLDGSELGETALRYVEGLVARLAPGEKVEVTLFHASQSTHSINVVGGNSVSVPYTDEELETLREKGESYLERAGQELKRKGAVVHCIVAFGDHPSEEIIRVEEEVEADLVAMSTHGRAGLSRWAFGSVTDKVLRAGKVPVLMVRAQKGKK